jgi:thiamine biosynthesis protein ThiI
MLVRYSGDVTTKARATRRRFIQRLGKNLKDALNSEGVASRLTRTHDRLFLETRGEGGLDAASRVFGAQAVSVVETLPWKRADDLVEAGARLFCDAVRDRQFAVRVRRVGERARIPIQSAEIERALGARLLPLTRGVNLGRPEVTARIEVMPGRAYFFLDSRDARGGLPVGVEGNAVALVSGGFDSAVAAWQLLKRGVALDYVLCNLGGRSHQIEALRVIKTLADRWSYGTWPRLHAVDFDRVSRDIQAKIGPRYWQVVLKRLMLRAAEAVAADRGAVAIVTGDAVGQVSSQTLQNLGVISRATALPILRPLVGFNKDEILSVARSIGTFELSKQVGEYCAMVPSKPATRAKLAAIEQEEARLDACLLDTAVAERSVLHLREFDLGTIDSPELEAEQIAEGATVLDLRSKAAYRAWHYPEALYLDFADALRAYERFFKSRKYVLDCECFLKSACLAELMHDAGYDASHFGRGLRELLDYARRRGVPTPDGS